MHSAAVAAKVHQTPAAAVAPLSVRSPASDIRSPNPRLSRWLPLQVTKSCCVVRVLVTLNDICERPSCAKARNPSNFKALLKDKLEHLACHLVQRSEGMIKRRRIVCVQHSSLTLHLAAGLFVTSAQFMAFYRTNQLCPVSMAPSPE